MIEQTLLRFEDLRARGIVRNRPQLQRLIAGAGFPRGFMLSANTKVFDAAEVDAWLDSRRALTAAA